MDAQPTPTPRRAITISGVTKAFGDNEVLRGVDLDVGEAENVVVLGRSGSGKSVLIKLLVALLPPDAGEIRVLDQDVHRLGRQDLDALRRRVGFVFQAGALYDSMSVEQNLSFPLRMNYPKLGAAEIRDRVVEALEGVALGDKLWAMPSDLSGGQRKRLGVARTLILRPEIMLYDEPTGGLDPVTSGEMIELINRVREDFRTSSIIITHDLTCARSTGDRVAMLLDGRVARLGTFDQVFETDDPRVRGFYDYNFISRGSP